MEGVHLLRTRPIPGEEIRDFADDKSESPALHGRTSHKGQSTTPAGVVTILFQPGCEIQDRYLQIEDTGAAGTAPVQLRAAAQATSGRRSGRSSKVQTQATWFNSSIDVTYGRLGFYLLLNSPSPLV
jgi:hypothetical protein